jgi:hypothetical protein
MKRYYSIIVTSEGTDGMLWECSKGCDAMPMWVHLIVGLSFFLLIAFTILY